MSIGCDLEGFFCVFWNINVCTLFVHCVFIHNRLFLILCLCILLGAAVRILVNLVCVRLCACVGGNSECQHVPI